MTLAPPLVSGDPDPAHRRLIRERLGGPEYSAFFRTVRMRLEASGGPAARTVALTGLSEAERRAVADLHGWPTVPEERRRVSLVKLDAILRQSAVGAGVVAVVEALSGPLINRRAERQAAVRREEQLWTRAAEHPGVEARPEMRTLLEELRARGLLGRVARASRIESDVLLRQALEVAGRIPARGVPLSVLAAECTGDAHALDPGRPVAALALRMAARLAGWPQVPSSATARRRLWAEVGVLCDPLSAQVLMLGVGPTGNDRLSRHLRESAEGGEPRRVTLRELAGGPLAIASGTVVFICENPVVVAAGADRVGPRCAALVCTEGMPSTAALHLLGSLAKSGAALSFHADFDWAGLRIAGLLSAQLGATPWRFMARDYHAALAVLASEAVPLEGPAVQPAWDPGLGLAMRAAGRAVFEEQVIDSLLVDLAR